MGGGVRAQVSMEYLFTMIFVVLISAPLIILYYDQASSMDKQTGSSQAQRAAQTLTQAADTVYYLGAPTTRTVTITLPEGVVDVQLNSTALTIILSGDQQTTAWSVANLSGNVNPYPGPQTLRVVALPNSSVNISEA